MIIPRGIIIILLVIVLVSLSSLWVFFQRPQKEIKEPESKTEPLTREEPIMEKKIAMIIAFKDFKDEEYFVPKQVFEQADYQVITASYSSGTAQGADGGEAKVDILIDDLNVEDYEAVVFVGGPGAFKYLDDSRAHQKVQQTIQADKVLGAICIAPAILAKAGVLRDKQATVWFSALDKSAVKLLTDNGASFIEEDVVVDGKIITANGPAAAREFGQTIVNILR